MRSSRFALALRISLLPWMATGVTGEFSSIPKRNVFGLLPPPPKLKPVPPQLALPQVHVQGLTTLLGTRQVLLGIQVKGNPPLTEVHCILSEGQSRAGVRILRIDMGTGTVWLTNQGEAQVLTLAP